MLTVVLQSLYWAISSAPILFFLFNLYTFIFLRHTVSGGNSNLALSSRQLTALPCSWPQQESCFLTGKCDPSFATPRKVPDICSWEFSFPWVGFVIVRQPLTGFLSSAPDIQAWQTCLATGSLVLRHSHHLFVWGFLIYGFYSCFSLVFTHSVRWHLPEEL